VCESCSSPEFEFEVRRQFHDLAPAAVPVSTPWCAPLLLVSAFLLNNILDRVAGSDPSVRDYILEALATCPNCWRDVLEKTLIGLK